MDGLNGFLRQRLHVAEPLRRDQRLDSGLATLALTDRKRVILNFYQVTLRFQIGNDPFASFIAIKAGVSTARGRNLSLLVDHFDLFEVVTLPGFEVIGVVRRGYFDDARAELRVSQIVEDDRNVAIHQRQAHRLAM